MLAGVLAQVRSGAHLPAVQAGPGMDRAKDPRPGRGGPVDLADHRLLRPAAPGPAAGRRPAPPLGTARTAGPAHPGPGPPRLPEHPREGMLPGRCAKTRQTRPGQTARVKEPPPRTPPRRGKNDEERTHPQGTPQTRRLNGKLRSGGAEESHRAPTDPCVTVSRYMAP